MKFVPGDKVVKLNGQRMGIPALDKRLKAGTRVGVVTRVNERTVSVDWGYANEDPVATNPATLMRVEDAAQL